VDFLPGLGDLQQSDAAGSGGYEKKLQAYSATLRAQLGSISLTSLSGYNINTLNDSFDYTPLFATFTKLLFGVTGTPLFDHLITRKFTQEIRLDASVGELFDWLFGAFYNYEKTKGNEDLLATDFFTAAPAGQWGQFRVPNTYTEYAVFADLTFHVMDRFDIQVGGRESYNDQDFAETVTGPYALLFNKADPFVYPEVHTHENAFTYLFTPKYKLSPDLMVYARLASGYRPGGPNTNIALGLPSTYRADRTHNYEIGVKGDVLNQLLSFDASIYYIDWKDIQLRLTDPVSGETYFANGSRAKSQGLELSIEAKPLPGLAVSSWVTWNDAKLTEDFPAASTAAGGVHGISGDRLPYGSRFSGNLSVDQQFPLMEKLVAFVGAAVSYVGEREGTFTSTSKRQVFPAYAKTDLHVGATYDTWNLNVYVNNVTDRRGELGGGLGTYNPAAFTLIQPRTVGLTLSRTF
jgi:outer membrane receptor protein involved in Fe transport